MCNLILCYVDMLVCFAWIVAQLPDQRPSFLAVVRQMVETDRGEPKVTVYGGAGRKEIVGECSTGMVGGKQQI